jgi:hypothetical protein
MTELARIDLARTIAARLEFGYASGIDIEADYRRALPAESNGDRQSDEAKTDDSKFSTVSHDRPPVSALTSCLCLIRVQELLR